MLIYVLRHGITQWNKLKKVQGAMDIPLAPEGIELAKRTGEALKDVPFDICFTSPLTRARPGRMGRRLPFFSVWKGNPFIKQRLEETEVF